MLEALKSEESEPVSISVVDEPGLDSNGSLVAIVWIATGDSVLDICVDVVLTSALESIWAGFAGSRRLLVLRSV